MTSCMTAKQHVDYWLKLAAEDMAVMRSNLRAKHRTYSLFFGHLALEKMLKALCAAKRIQVIKEHNLYRLANRAGLILDTLQTSQLTTITGFNIAARYNDYRLQFHKQCTPTFTKHWVGIINDWYKYLKPIVKAERKNLPRNCPIV